MDYIDIICLIFAGVSLEIGIVINLVVANQYVVVLIVLRVGLTPNEERKVICLAALSTEEIAILFHGCAPLSSIMEGSASWSNGTNVTTRCTGSTRSRKASPASVFSAA